MVMPVIVPHRPLPHGIATPALLERVVASALNSVASLGRIAHLRVALQWARLTRVARPGASARHMLLHPDRTDRCVRRADIAPACGCGCAPAPYRHKSRSRIA
jgi:hypothetical protein